MINPVHPTDAPNVQILKPFPGGGVLGTPNGPDTEFEVEVEALGAEEVSAKIHLPSEFPATTPEPIGFTELEQVGMTDIWKGTVSIPSSSYNCNLFATDLNNLGLTVAVMRDATWDPAPNRLVFKAVCETQYIDVHAWCCPWFANADPGLIGPVPACEEVDAHRPVRAPVPALAKRVEITATGSWRHEQTIKGTSDANGYGNSQPLTVNAYRDEYYNSAGMTSPAVDPLVNTLVGLLQPAAAGPATAVQVIGVGPTTLDVSASRGIFFGMWDGVQWNRGFSNTGTLRLTLNWKRV